MKEKIENRLKVLYAKYKHLTNKDIIWIKPTCGSSRRQELEKCEILIKELESLLT